VDAAAIHARKVRLLTDLVRELAGYRFGVTLGDAAPAALIYSAPGQAALEVTVRDERFIWRGGDHSHPAGDPAGAAAAMAAQIWKHAGDLHAAQPRDVDPPQGPRP
jgi:hypothetical protein